MTALLAMQREEWRPIAEAPQYAISSVGRVSTEIGRVLRPWRHKSGHLYVSLGRGRKRQVHRLVLETFGGAAPAGTECRHLDGDPTNNAAANLAWGTRAENIADLKATSGRFAKASVSDAIATEIRKRFTGKRGEQTALAAEFGLNLSLVNRIVRGKTYGHLEH